MDIRELNRNAFLQVYRQYMVKDFPRSELKTPGMILRSIRMKKYRPLAVFDGEAMVAYAFFVVQGKHYLLDYFAVIPEKRDQGIGSQCLALLLESLSEAGSFILEVEDPDSAKSESEAVIRRRRLNFYLRCGMMDPGIAVRTFGVDFKLLVRECDLHIPDAEIRRIYRGFFRQFMPEAVCRKYIIT